MTDLVEVMARAHLLERQRGGFSGVAEWEFEPPEIQALYMATARAALQALKDAGYVVSKPRPCTVCGQLKIRESEQ